MPRLTRNSNAASETGKVEALLLEAVKFLGNDKPANFPLRVRGKRLEDDFFIEASDQFRSEKFVEFGNDGPLQRREMPMRPSKR